MKKTTPRLAPNEYDGAYLNLLRHVLDGFHNMDSFMGHLPPVETEHCGPTIYTQSETDTQAPLEQPQTTFRFGASADLDVRAPDLDAHCQFLHDFAQSYLSAVAPRTMDGVMEIAEAHGQRVNAQGKPPSWDLWIAALEKIDLDFDAGGQPIMPTVYLNSKTAEDFKKALSQPRTPEQERRFTEVMTRKKTDYDARHPPRRLSR